MLEYRYGALYIFPPNGVIQPVDELRKKYDPRSASYCQAHISLSKPLPKPLSESQISELKPHYVSYSRLTYITDLSSVFHLTLESCIPSNQKMDSGNCDPLFTRLLTSLTSH